MDGLPHLAPNDASVSDRSDHQRTLKAAIGCVGVGLHSGCRVEVTLRPAPVDGGVVFRRVDLGLDHPARFDHVADTRLCTVLALPDRPDVCVGTIEHLMAALSALGVGNVVVEVDGPELPVLDGSAAPWLFLLDCAGLAALDAPASVVEVLRPVRVEDGEAFAELRPSRSPLDLTMAIEFDAAAIGRQALTLQLDEGAFRQELAAARTFTQVHEVAGLQAAGLARGGSLDNAVVVDGARVLNPAGLRMTDEFVRHKMLDALGDLALAGAPLIGAYRGVRAGHGLTNALLRRLFATQGAWAEVALDVETARLLPGAGVVPADLRRVG